MRGRGGHCTSSSSATRQRSRMALRKQSIQNISSVSQQEDENTEEDGASDSTDNRDELSSLLRSTSSTRDKRRAERKNHSKQKEMTEEEMMDLAVQLSKQEASNTALRQQREDEDVMKAIQESMVSQTQPCLSSPRKPLADGAALSTGSRRKLSYSNGEKVPEECCASQGDTNSVVRPGDDTISRSKKRKRGAGSPLPEMPDLSQNICSQSFPRSPESFPVHLDSPQSSDSTHIEDSQLQMSPVFPQTGCRAEVHINRLDLDLVETCKTSGFVLCSQDSLISTQKSGHPRSPTFPQSNQISCPKSPVFPGEHKGHQGQLEQSPKFVKSPVFDRTAECEKAPGASNHPACENVEFDFSSQESLIPTVRPSPPQSLVFPKSPPGCLPAHEDSGRGAAERSEERSETPLFGLTDQQDEPAELQGSDVHLSPSDHVKGTSDGGQTAESSRHSSKSASEEVKEESEGWNPAETELTSDMTLVWSEQDEDDVTPVGSPSPVFPEEKAGVAAASRPGSSLNHVSAASQGASGSDSSLKSQKCDPGFDKPASSGTGSSSTSAARQEPHPVGSPEAVSGVSPQPDGPSEIQTFHYYWGVPFCPRGLDPDTYTQVIVAQMEVYEKSLKQAQRSLLRKAEWGEAIQPQPQESLSPEPRAESAQPCVPRRRGLRLRGSKRSEAAGFVLEEEEDKKDEGEDEQQQEKEQEGNNEGDAAQTDTDCEVCPETQLSDNDSTKDLTLDADSETQPLQRGPELPEIQMILRDDSPTTDEPQEPDLRMKTSADPLTEENDSGCREDPGGRPAEEAGERKVNSRGPDVEEKKDRGLRGPESPELEAAVVPRSPETSVDCPICQGSFPVSEIELHAAYCDGEVAVVRQRRMDSQGYRDSVKPRRKRVRRADVESEETSSLSDVGRRQEKCYICQKLVSLRDYSSHTELCLQRGTTRRTAKGNLLSALEQTESRDSGAGPSGSKIQPEAVIDLRDDDDGEETYKISDSPIRSFTPISEATGCLIDFRKQQRTKKPSQRRR